jgi:hypothetical protein
VELLFRYMQYGDMMVEVEDDEDDELPLLKKK